MSTTATLQQLPPERWGRRLARMRDLADLTQEQARERLAECMITSDSTISRLEGLEAPPPSRKRRMTAWTLSVLYGFDPSELDLTVEDAPPPAVLDRLAVRLDEGVANRPSVAEDPLLSVPA